MACSDKDILKYAVENGIIDLTILRDVYKMKDREKYLEMHDKKIYESKGFYLTRLDGRLIKRKKLDDLEELIVEHYKANAEHTVYEVFEEWINNKLDYREIQRQTYDRYYADFKRFITDSVIDKDIKYIDEDLLEGFIRCTIRDMNLTAKAWGKLRLLLKGIFKWGKKHDYTELNIVDFLNELELSPKIFKKRRFTDEESVFTDEEVDRLTATISLRDPSIINYGIVLAFQTGLRVGELSSLTWDDIKDKYITVNKTEICYKNEKGSTVYEVRDNAKTDAGDRNVIILNDAKDTLTKIKELNPYGEYIFMRDGERIKGKAFTKKLERLCGQLGIVVKSMHKARKTYATKLIDAGVKKSLIIRQLGHTNIKTTDIFYYFNNKTVVQNEQELIRALS